MQTCPTLLSAVLLVLQSEGEVSYNHTDKLVSTATLDVQTIHTDALFTGKLETRFNNLPKNSYKTLKARAERRAKENKPDADVIVQQEHSKRNMTALGFIVSRLKDEGGLPTSVPALSVSHPGVTAHSQQFGHAKQIKFLFISSKQSLRMVSQAQGKAQSCRLDAAIACCKIRYLALPMYLELQACLHQLLS